MTEKIHPIIISAWIHEHHTTGTPVEWDISDVSGGRIPMAFLEALMSQTFKTDHETMQDFIDLGAKTEEWFRAVIQPTWNEEWEEWDFEVVKLLGNTKYV